MPPGFRGYACETRVVSELGAISRIPDELQTCHITKPALVVDSGIAKAGLLEKWLPEGVLSIPTRILAPVNPDLDSVQRGINAAKEAQCDGVLIIGGGSTICLGKAIAIMLVNPGHILDYEGDSKLKNVSASGMPFVMDVPS
jgi:alcohol dehydrogenase class IV